MVAPHSEGLTRRGRGGRRASGDRRNLQRRIGVRRIRFREGLRQFFALADLVRW